MAATGTKSGWLYIKNWDKFQHYKKRTTPPWIKLHRTLLVDPLFSSLSDRDKAHLMLIWCFASNYDGAVPNDRAFLRRRLGLKTDPNLEILIEQGWLVENASAVLAPCYQDASLEVEEKRKEEKRRETSTAILMKKIPEKPKPTEADLLKAKRIGEAVATGNIALAEQIRNGTA